MQPLGRNAERRAALVVVEEKESGERSARPYELRYAREEFASLPDEIKLWPLNPPLDLADPSEMIRSDRIVAAIESRFEIVRHAPYWGNFLFPLLCAVDGTMLASGQPHHALWRGLRLRRGSCHCRPRGCS